LLSLSFLLGCTRNQILDLGMVSAPHHERRPTHVGAYELLAGDLHCHVHPPDADYHVSRELDETAKLAAEEGLDFVVLTPHVPSRFFLDPEKREWVRGTQEFLRARIAALTTDVLLVPGMEYTDDRFGHVGLAFANVGAVLDEIPFDASSSTPELFFVEWQKHGGTATLNHPVLRALPHAPVADLRYDRSWRAFRPGASFARSDVPSEIRWLSEHADAIETYNASISHIRDRYLFDDPEWTLRESSHLVDRIARAQHRHVTPVGGTDSHGEWLRPTTWVLAAERKVEAIRDAIVHGRTCVRAPEGCTLEVRGSDGAFHLVGSSIRSNGFVEARVHGGPSTYFLNGVPAKTGASGELVRIATPGRCSLLRVNVGESRSAPVYVDCE
jgi:predicted metal-dependent phosphoesterase TrpH